MAGKIGELLVELRAGSATMQTDIEKAKRVFGQVPASAEAAQRRLTEIMERGEPLKAAERKANEEIAALQKAQQTGLINAQQFEQARTKILTSFAETRQAVETRSADEAKRALEESQRKVVEILERGDPLKALRRRTREELATLRDYHRQGLVSEQQFAAARARLLTSYSSRRTSFQRGAANDDVAVPAPGGRTGDIYGQLTYVGERMEGVRSVMAALGMQSNSAMDGVTLFTSALVKGAGKATLFGFALAGIGAGVNMLIEHFAELKRVETQMEALAQTFSITDRDVRMVGNAFADFTGELDRGTVQAIMKAGLEAGLTASEIAGMGAEVKRLMALDGSTAVDAASKAAQDAARRKAEGVHAKARTENDARERDLFGPSRFEELHAVAEKLEREALRVSNEIRMAERNSVSIVDATAREQAEDAIRVLRGERVRLRTEAQQIRNEAERSSMLEGAGKARKDDEADAAKAKAEGERQQREAEQARKRTAEERKRELEREKKERDSRRLELEREIQAAKDLLHERTVVDQAENERIGRVQLAREKELLALEEMYAAKIELQQADLAWEEEYLRLRAEINSRSTDEIAAIRRDEAKKLADGLAKAHKESLRQAGIDERASEQGLIAGIRAGESFILGFKRVAEGKGSATDWLGLMFQTAGAVASFIPGGQPIGAGLGALGSIIGSFADGGMITGIGGPRDDRNLAFVSPGEFIVNAAATRRARPLLEAINGGSIGHAVSSIPAFANGGYVGKGAAAGAGGNKTEIHIHERAFSPADSKAAVKTLLAPVVPEIRETRQSARMFDAYAPRAPRHS